jgi:tetratricopeptide (TPR) repeat protein
MSIINQMLRDLENRTKHSGKAESATADLQTAIFSPRKLSIRKNWLESAFVLISITCLSIVLYKNITYQHVQRDKMPLAFINQNSTVPLATQNNTFKASLHLTPTILTGITLQTQKQTTYLRFLLTQDTLYRVSSNAKNQLIIELDNARLVSSLPSFNTLDSAIENIQVSNQTNGNLRILLTLKPGSELNHLELNQASKFPELQVDLLADPILAMQDEGATNKNSVVEEKSSSIIRLRTDLTMSEKYQEALNLSSQGRTDEAINILTELMAKYPEYATARESLATLLISQGNISQAQQVIRVGLQQRPFYPPYIQLKARILVNEGKVKQALNLLQLEPPPLAENPDYHALIAALYQRQGQPNFAEKLYEQLLVIQPHNPTWWTGLGIALESLGKRTLAINAYTKVKESSNLSPELKIYAETRLRNLLEMQG